MMKCSNNLWESLRASMQTGRRTLAMLLTGAVLLCTLPVARISASAAEISNNPGFHVTAYDQSVRIDIPAVTGAVNYKVYLSQSEGMTDFSGAECVFDSGYEAYAYAVKGDKDAADPSKTISINFTNGGSNTYYFYLVTNDGTNSTVQSTVEAATRQKENCYWTSPGVYDSGWYGDGSADTYTISTAAQLAGLAELVNSGINFQNKTVKLATSIDLSPNLWTPIGTADMDNGTMQPFSGTFDGENNVVSGLHTNDSSNSLQGLFGFTCGGATLKNVSIVNGSVRGSSNVGGVVGIAGGTVIDNCHNTCKVTGQDEVGGIAGGVHDMRDGSGDCTIKDCYNMGVVSGTNGYVGGITGDASGTITNCYNTGAVSSLDDEVGGITGENGNLILNCYNTGTVSGEGKDVGGITGYANGEATNCYNTGTVSGAGDNVGGIEGYAYYYGNLKNCYNTGTIRGTGSYIGGVTGLNNGAEFINCCNTGSVSTTGSASKYVGGIVGYHSNKDILNCYNIGPVSSMGDYVGGVAGQDYFATIQNCYNIGSVSGTGANIGGTAGNITGRTSVVKNSYSAGLVNGSEADLCYGSSGNTPTAFSDKTALLNAVNSGGAFRAAPTQYAAGGVFSASNPVNQGYPVLKAFGYTGDDTSGDTEFSKDADGTTYLIQNAYQMDLVRDFSGKAFKLAGNISLSPAQYNKTQNADGSWKTINAVSYPYFYGSFDGSGYSVSGVYIDNKAGSYLGLFGSGVMTIQNLGVSDGKIKGLNYVGGIIGWSLGTGTIENCYYLGTVDGTTYVGGVVGAGATLKGCYAVGSVNSSGTDIGGVVGVCDNATACYNAASVSGPSYVGGITGWVEGKLTSCYNIGMVSATDRMGGIAGEVPQNGVITGCYNAGPVNCSAGGGIAGSINGTLATCYNIGTVDGECVGGIFGRSYEATVANCYNTGSVSGTSYIGGIAGSNSMAISDCYNSGSIKGSGFVGGIAGATGNGIKTCYNIGIVSGKYAGGIVGYFLNSVDDAFVDDYYSGCSQGCGEQSVYADTDEIRPFVSCVNPDVGKTETIKELSAADLSSDFKATFGITAIQYPDGYESSYPSVLSVSDKKVTRGNSGSEAITGTSGANFNSNIIISQNALNMTDSAAGFSGAGTTAAVGYAVVAFTAQHTGTDKKLTGITQPDPITGIASGAAKTADGLHLPPTVTLVTDGGSVSASVAWDMNSCAYDPTHTSEQSFTVSGTVLLPTGVVNPNNVPLQVSIGVTIGASSGGNSGKTVSGFESLTDAVKNQTAAIGTVISSLNLPQKLKVAADGISGLYVRVSNWICSTFNSSVFSKAGTYIFTPVLDNTYHDSGYVDSGYTVANGASLPSIAVTVQNNSSDGHSSSTSSSSSSTASSQTTQTRVDTASNTATVTTVPSSVTQSGNTTQIDISVPSVTEGTGGSLDTGKAGQITIRLPESAIVQQLNAKQNVDLTLSVPSSVAHQTSGRTAISIPVGSDVFAAAKTSASDLVINIKDADTKQLAYTWTFRGADLAKSTAPITDVNISMAIRLTTEVSQVNRLTPNNTGLVLMFDHSGVLPSTASLTFSAKEKGFKPGQKLYFYFYNASAGQLESQTQEYTVDADGNVTVQISHCSNYVLLPNKARTITLDTRVYTMPVGHSYITGVKLTGVSGAKLKSYSSTKGVVDVTVLKNGNVMATGKKTGITYVMIDVYDNKNKFLTHASVRLIITNSGKPKGNSQRQFGIF